MAIPEFDSWRNELMLTGRIAQDGDSADAWEKSEAQVGRYLELLEMARGVYEKRVFQALLDSMQVEDDYEVYETTIGVIFSFPPEQFGSYLVECFASFLERDPERSGDFLSLMVNNSKSGETNLHEFKRALRNTTQANRKAIAIFIKAQEKSGWLDTKRGWYDDALHG